MSRARYALAVRPCRCFLFAFGFAIWSQFFPTVAAAVSINVDYRYDSTNFFGSGNPQGAAAGGQARAAVEAAAAMLSQSLEDPLIGFSVPERFTGASPGSFVEWGLSFENPTTASPTTLTNETLGTEELLVFVGTKNFGGTTLATAGTGGLTLNSGGLFAPTEITQINGITSQFSQTADQRGQSDGLPGWGGTISFDRSNTWQFNPNQAPSTGENDLYSVALHEMMHVLGFGISDPSPDFDTPWENLIVGNRFAGSEATASNGSRPIVVDGNAHWSASLTSQVYNGGAQQTPLMAAVIPPGTRVELTELDAAALSDIGWEVAASSGVAGDFNNDQVVDGADYTVWRAGLGGSYTNSDFALWRESYGSTTSGTGQSVAIPEPSASLLALLAMTAAPVLRLLQN